MHNIVMTLTVQAQTGVFNPKDKFIALIFRQVYINNTIRKNVFFYWGGNNKYKYFYSI